MTGSARGLQPLPVLGAELGVQAKQQQQEELVNQLVEEEPSSSSSESEEEDAAGPGNGAAGQPEATGQGNAKSAGDVPEIAIPVSPNPSSGPAAAPSLRTKSPGYRIRKGFRKAVEDLPLFYRCLHCCDKRARNQVHPARSFHRKQRVPPPKGCWKRTKHIFAEHRLVILLIATLLISAVVTGPIEGWTFVQTAYYTVVTTTTGTATAMHGSSNCSSGDTCALFAASQLAMAICRPQKLQLRYLLFSTSLSTSLLWA